MRTTLPEPWLSFLKELDPIAAEPTKIPCIGGFAVTQYYGSSRTTVDLDVIDVAPIASRNRLLEAGGKGFFASKEASRVFGFRWDSPSPVRVRGEARADL